jgi:hypothetical protein
MPRPIKSFDKYLLLRDERYISPDDYAESPATAFLNYAVDAKDAVNYCSKYFQRNKDRNFNQDSQDSLRHISVAMLPSLMGHFESYEKAIFAGLFEWSRFVLTFDPESFIKRLEDTQKIQLDLRRLSAYRGQPAQVGQLLADALTGWHDPSKVNLFIKALGPKLDFFSNNDCEQLRILWQLRHSIVHTGGWITLPDAQKIKQLHPFGDHAVIFQDHFIPELSHKLHRLVSDANRRLEAEFFKMMPNDFPVNVSTYLKRFFQVESSMKAWLPKTKKVKAHKVLSQKMLIPIPSS